MMAKTHNRRANAMEKLRRVTWSVVAAFGILTAQAAHGYEVSIVDLCDGPCIAVRGEMATGVAGAVQKAINENPQIKKIWLWSNGGWVDSGWWLYKTIKKNRMDTYTKRCWSACTMAFIAGKNRILIRGSGERGLGFHKVSVDGSVTANSLSGEGKVRNLYRKTGVKNWFIKKAFEASPHQMWYPTPRELLDAGFITAHKKIS